MVADDIEGGTWAPTLFLELHKTTTDIRSCLFSGDAHLSVEEETAKGADIFGHCPLL
jgi:hypothetical protein